MDTGNVLHKEISSWKAPAKLTTNRDQAWTIPLLYQKAFLKASDQAEVAGEHYFFPCSLPLFSVPFCTFFSASPLPSSCLKLYWLWTQWKGTIPFSFCHYLRNSTSFCEYLALSFMTQVMLLYSKPQCLFPATSECLCWKNVPHKGYRAESNKYHFTLVSS